MAAIDRSTVYRYKWGDRSEVDFDVAAKLRDALGIPLDAWKEKPARRFSPPGATARTGTEG